MHPAGIGSTSEVVRILAGSHRKKLIVFDIDGTLLDSHRNILPSTRSSVAQLIDAGHHVALASARPPRSVSQLSSDLLSGSSRELIALNGAHISHADKVLKEHTLTQDSVLTLVQRARMLGLQTNVLSNWDWFVEDINQYTIEEIAIVEFDPILVVNLEGILTRPVHKLMFIGQAELVRSFRDFVLASGLSVEASLSKPTYCEVVAQGVSKAGAVDFLGQVFGVTSNDTVAFGDGENDLPMILAAGTGVAMGNAMDIVKRSAAFVTMSNDEDGIALALIQLGLIAGSGPQCCLQP